MFINVNLKPTQYTQPLRETSSTTSVNVHNVLVFNCWKLSAKIAKSTLSLANGPHSTVRDCRPCQFLAHEGGQHAFATATGASACHQPRPIPTHERPSSPFSHDCRRHHSPHQHDTRQVLLTGSNFYLAFEEFYYVHITCNLSSVESLSLHSGVSQSNWSTH